MLIGILSDTHDRVEITRRAIDLLLEKGAQYLIHCGDLCSEPIVELLAGQPAAFVLGNNDWDRRPLEQTAADLGVQCLGVSGTLSLGGRQIHVQHGDDFARMKRALGDPHIDILLHGHTHVPRDERVGQVRIINPGALHRAPVKTVTLLDLDSGALQLLRVDPE